MLSLYTICYYGLSFSIMPPFHSNAVIEVILIIGTFLANIALLL